MRKLNAWKLAGAVLMFCAATAIAAPAQTFDDLLDFDGRDGANPGYGFLVQGHDGNFYGTTMAAGGNLRKSEGTVFEITPSGRLVTLYSFCPIFPRCPDGDGPSGLVLGTDGNFYGTTASAGANQRQSMPGGTVFRITPQGQLTTLYSFCAEPSCLDGTIPLSWLVEGADGNFYGTTTAGGAGVCSSQGCGTVFKITPSGKLTTLHSFCTTFPCLDGATPYAGLVLGIDGNFYGTTSEGGPGNCDSVDGGCGTVFKIAPTGVLTTVHSFERPDGGGLVAGLIQARDGNFYGTASGYGAEDGGTVYEMTPEGKLTVLHNFSEYLDGTEPYGTVIQASDGNLYGTTYAGGLDNGWGTAFEITPAGAFTTLHTFCVQPGCPDGTDLLGGMLQATSGTLFGTTTSGGSTCPYGCGTVFSLSTGVGPFVAFVRSYGKVGQGGGILGQGFTGTTSVSFNGASANFKVVSDTYLTATVPAGATTGHVTVTTPSGTLTSNVPFHVIQ